MENNKEKSLALIGVTKKYFDETNKILVPAFELKFLIIQDPHSNDIKMLLMEEYKPCQFHAQALLGYMNLNDFSEIKVNGGGKVTFNSKYMSFWGRSYSFGQASAQEVEFFSKTLWPNVPVVTTLDKNRRVMAIDGKIYTGEQVVKEIQNA